MTQIRMARAIGCLSMLLMLESCTDYRDPAPSLPEIGGCQAGDLRVLPGLIGLSGPCSARLHPGEKVVLQLPSGSAFEVRASRDLSPGDLRVGVSNGTGLIAYPEIFSLDGALVLPAQDSASVLHVERPSDARGEMQIRFRVSGTFESSIRRARRLSGMDIPGTDAIIKRPGGRDAEFTLLAASAPTQISVTGPATLALQTRLLLEGTSDWTRSYRVNAALNGVPRVVLEYEAGPDVDARVEGNTGLVVGSPQTEYIDIPEGDHLLQINPSQQLFARLSVSKTPQRVSLSSSWDLPQSQVGDLGAFACTSPAQLERVARRTARDNKMLGGSLTAVEQLRSIASTRADRRQIEASASRLESAYSFFRDLVPHSPEGFSQEIAYVDELRIPQDGADRTASAIGGLPTPVLLDRLVRAVFVPVPLAGSLSYLPPPREAASELRLLVDQTALEAPANIYMSLDGGTPTRVLALPEAEVPRAVDNSSPASQGLLRLAEAAGVAPGAVTETDVFGTYQIPARLLEAGTIRLPLPAKSRAIRVWAGDPSRDDVRVALQYRAAATPTLGEAAYAAEINSIGAEAARELFAEAVQSAVACADWLEQPGRCSFVSWVGESGPAAVDELYNTWTPLLRLLRARERTLFGSLPPERRIRPAAETAGPARVAERIAQAEQATQAQRMLDALEHWTEVAEITQGETWARSQLERARILEDLGEAFLAERILKNLYLTTESGSYRREAYQRLLEEYRSEGAAEAVLGLEVAELRRNFSVHSLEHLARALEAEGQDEMAATVALLLPGARANSFRDAMLRAGWATSASLLPGSTTKLRPVWESAEHMVTRSAGAADYLATARGTQGRFYRATSRQPLTLSINGPVRLRISARPLHDATGDEPVEGWFTVATGEREIQIPITGNQAAPGIELIGTKARAGTAVEEVVDIPTGRHTVTVGTESIPLLVSAETTSRSVPAQKGQLTPAQELAQLLHRFEAAPDQRRDLLVSAARFSERHASDSAVTSVWQRFLRRASWERVTSFDLSAGTRTVDLPRPQVESPALRTRLGLLPALDQGERFLSNTADTVVSLVNPEPAVVEGVLALETIPTLPSRPVTVRYQLDEEEPVTVTLAQGEPAHRFELPVSEGEHALHFSILSRHANQFVRLRLQMDGEPFMEESSRRRFEVSTPEEPAQLTLEGPAWLRLHEYQDGGTQVSYRAVEPGLQTVTFPPEDGEDQLLLRVFQLLPDTEAVDEPAQGAPAPRLAAPAERVPAITGGQLPVCAAAGLLPAEQDDQDDGWEE